LYWGTSEWPVNSVIDAWHVAERHHLHKPAVEQSRYNLIARARVESECRRLWDDLGVGLTAYSPLASGTLAGKYDAGVANGSRATLDGYERLRERLTNPSLVDAARALEPHAASFGCTRAQLAIAWCLRNPSVSSVITGASASQQVRENAAACDVYEALDAEQWKAVDAAVASSQA
jgi:aryl-alcohol dehydrogenase-like predicted oxidoreductase